jgi:ABC-type branched-subunit amino acid transport system ATPase component
MTTILSASNLRCGYGADEVLHGIDVSIEQGTIVAILGPNGCGKSTFLKTILGYLKATSGTIQFLGRDISGLSASAISALGIGYVPQLNNIFKPLTVLENLEMGGFLLSSSSRAERLEFLLDTFPLLRERRTQKAGILSGGERQLLAMARALMPSPRLMCLDEPSAGLSPQRVRDVFQHIAEIVALGTTILLVEQDVHNALSVADRGYVFATGLVAFVGPAKAILEDERMREAYLGHRRSMPYPSR